MIIDPLEAAINFLRTRTELNALGDRIADRQQYGSGWTQGESAIVVIQDGGTPDWYVEKHDVRLEVQCYADERADAADLDLSLLAISRSYARVTVTTGKGSALVYSFLPDSGMSYLPDTDVHMERVLRFWRVQVSEGSV